MRSGAYVLVLVILAGAYAARFSTFANAGEALYALSLLVAGAAALACGELALGRFRAERRDAFLLISAGLWVAAVLHLLHFAAYTGVLGADDSLLGAALVLRGQLLPTLFFALFLVLSLLAGRQDRPSTAQPGGVFLAAATLGFIVTVGALVFPVPQAGDVILVMRQTIPSFAAQPELLLVTGLVVVGIAGVVRNGRWRTEPFARWLLLAFIATLIALARFPLLNVWPAEAVLFLAQGFTLASYLCIIAGIASGTIVRPAASGVAESKPQPRKADAAAAEPRSAAKEQPAHSPERALHELQARHRALRNATDGLLVGVRQDGAITDWKPAADFGPTATPGELLGKNIEAVLPSDQAEAVKETVAQVLSAGKTERLYFAAADGSMVFAGLVAPHSADEVLCILRDHTALARALQELDEQRRAADSLRRVTGDWLIRITRAGIIQDLQPPAASESESYAGMFAGKHLQEVFQGDDVEPLLAAAEAALASHELQELSFLRQSGQVLAVRIVMYDAESALCLLRDTTDLAELAAQLQESDETTQALRAHLDQLSAKQEAALSQAATSVRVLQDLLPDLVLRVGADGTILECKPAESFGPSDGESVANARIREVLPVDLASQIMAAVERVQSSEQPQRFVCHPVGGQALAGGVAALVDDQYLCVVRDQTHLKQLEAALVQQATELAQEIRAKLEEEFLRSLRSENDVLRAHLLRVAELALEGGTASTGTAHVTGPTPSSIAGSAAQPSGPVQPPAAKDSRAGATPAESQPRTGASSLPPPPTALQASRDPATAPDASRDADSLPIGESPVLSAEAGTDDAPRISAEVATAEAIAQADTAVATQVKTDPAPRDLESGQTGHDAMTNGQPSEKKRPSQTGH